MKLYFLRHGETIGNKEGICQGWQEGDLTDLGHKQAQQAADYLLKERFDAIIVSDLRRTRQTAAPIIATHKEATVIFEPLVRERNQGIFEGSQHGTFINYINDNNIDILTFKPEGGESILDVQERARTYYQELIKNYANKTVLVVSHGGFLSQIYMYLLGKENTKENYDLVHPGNATLSLCEGEKTLTFTFMNKHEYLF